MIQEYLEYIKSVKGLSYNTIDGYKKDLHQFVQYAKEKGLKWSTLTEQDIDAWLASMAAQGLTGKTRNRRLSAVRTLLSWAYHKGILSNNAARFCQSAKIRETLPQAMSVEKIDAFLENRQPSTSSNITALMVAIMLETGMRLSETMAIKVEDINTEDKTIRTIGKGYRERYVIYGKRTEKELKQWLPAVKGRLLPSWSQTGFRAMIKEQLQPFTGNMHPHQLRHTFATEMLNNGMPITTLKTLMGHQHSSTTEIYCKVAKRTAQREYAKAEI